MNYSYKNQKFCLQNAVSHSWGNSSYVNNIGGSTKDKIKMMNVGFIVHNEMRELAGMILGSCKEGDRLILCGGVMEHFGDRILPVLKQYITENIQFIKPKLPPIYGACVSSMERFYGKAGNDYTGNFEKDYRRLKGES